LWKHYAPTSRPAGSERHRRLAPFRSQPSESPDIGSQRSDFRFQSEVLHDSLCLPSMIASLQPALTVRAPRLDVAHARRSVGADAPGALLDSVLPNGPLLAAHRSALATGQPRPAAEQFADLVDQAWQAAGG
jgi:hypothetical protein